MKKIAVVFAYHNVGVRCLKVLLAQGIDIRLVVTHEDNPSETIWFESVDTLCRAQNIAVITLEATSSELFTRIQAIKPDFIFSFYYRNMLPVELLALAKNGAYNMHGSLLPKYRGRAPVNWAVLQGETETGITLHEMTAKPDAGDIIAQTQVPILPDDTAYEVFGKLTVAAEKTLWNALPGLLTGNVKKIPNDLSKGSYFSGRKPEAGRIDWTQPAQSIYNLHRAVAPPYPGAFTEVGGQAYIIGKARLDTMDRENCRDLPLGLAVVDHCILGVCGDDRRLHIIELLADGKQVLPAELHHILNRLQSDRQRYAKT